MRKKKIKKSFQRFRSNLEKNKIFFEIFSIFALSIMAIIVSVKANEISLAQTKIMQNENQPNFDILFYQERTDSSTIPTSFWNVYNRGGRVTNFDLKDISFLRATIYYGDEYQEKLIPLYDYFDPRHEITGETVGLIETLNNNWVKTKHLELNQSFLKKGYIEIESYIKISYTDFLDKQKTLYFQLSPIREISRKEWDSLSRYRIVHRQLDLDKLSFEKIKMLEGYNCNR